MICRYDKDFIIGFQTVRGRIIFEHRKGKDLVIPLEHAYKIYDELGEAIRDAEEYQI